MLPLQGGKGSNESVYGPYSDKRPEKVQDGSGPLTPEQTTEAIIRDMVNNYEENMDHPADKEDHKWSMEESLKVQEAAAIEPLGMDNRLPEVIESRPTGSAIEPMRCVFDSMGRVVDQNEVIKRSTSIRLAAQRHNNKEMTRKIESWTDNMPALYRKMNAAGIKATLMLMPDWSDMEVYVLLRGVDRDSAISLLKASKWLVKVPVENIWYPSGWKIR